jgi:6-phosphogluconolactonase/glucosamine-6-phosphate isomerase/deaminase
MARAPTAEVAGHQVGESAHRSAYMTLPGGGDISKVYHSYYREDLKWSSISATYAALR